MKKKEMLGKRQGIKFLMKVRKDPLNYFTKLMQEEGDYAWFDIMGEKVLLLNDATGIEVVLKEKFECFKKGKFYKILRPLLGQGIFLTDKSLWKKQREESLPVFSGKNFSLMTEQICDSCDLWKNRIEKAVNEDKSFDMNKESMWFTLDVVLRALFHEEREQISEKMNDAMKITLSDAEQRIWGAFLLPQKLVMKLPKYKNALGFIDSLVQGLVDNRKFNKSYPNDLLSTLIKNYNETPEEQKILKDQIVNFLLAGHETTSNALTWFFYEVSQRLEVKNRIIEELNEKLGHNPITYENLMELTYTRAVFNEVLRLYPPVWTMSRTAIVDTKIELDDGSIIDVPEGKTVMLCPYAVHRREKYWDNPSAFDPERFLSNSERPTFSYFPFSLGPRLCIGHKFALIESLAAIAILLKDYDFYLVAGQTIKPDPIITLRPNNPVLFKIKKRKDASLDTREKNKLKNQVFYDVQKTQGCPYAYVSEISPN